MSDPISNFAREFYVADTRQQVYLLLVNFSSIRSLLNPKQLDIVNMKLSSKISELYNSVEMRDIINPEIVYYDLFLESNPSLSQVKEFVGKMLIRIEAEYNMRLVKLYIKKINEALSKPKKYISELFSLFIDYWKLSHWFKSDEKSNVRHGLVFIVQDIYSNIKVTRIVLYLLEVLDGIPAIESESQQYPLSENEVKASSVVSDILTNLADLHQCANNKDVDLITVIGYPVIVTTDVSSLKDVPPLVISSLQHQPRIVVDGVSHQGIYYLPPMSEENKEEILSDIIVENLVFDDPPVPLSHDTLVKDYLAEERISVFPTSVVWYLLDKENDNFHGLFGLYKDENGNTMYNYLVLKQTKENKIPYYYVAESESSNSLNLVDYLNEKFKYYNVIANCGTWTPYEPTSPLYDLFLHISHLQ